MIALSDTFELRECEPLREGLPPLYVLMHRPMNGRLYSFFLIEDAKRVVGYLEGDTSVDWHDIPSDLTAAQREAYRLSFYGCCAMAGCVQSMVVPDTYGSRSTDDLERRLYFYGHYGRMPTDKEMAS